MHNKFNALEVTLGLHKQINRAVFPAVCVLVITLLSPAPNTISAESQSTARARLRRPRGRKAINSCNTTFTRILMMPCVAVLTAGSHLCRIISAGSINKHYLVSQGSLLGPLYHVASCMGVTPPMGSTLTWWGGLCVRQGRQNDPDGRLVWVTGATHQGDRPLWPSCVGWRVPGPVASRPGSLLAAAGHGAGFTKHLLRQ